MAGGGAGGDAPDAQASALGLPYVSRERLSPHGIQRITVEFSEKSRFHPSHSSGDGARPRSIGHEGSADAVLKTRIGCQRLEEIVLAQRVQFDRCSRDDGPANRPLEVSRDHTEAFTETEFFVELTAHEGIGDAPMSVLGTPYLTLRSSGDTRAETRAETGTQLESITSCVPVSIDKSYQYT